jgi:hypothetical protein
MVSRPARRLLFAVAGGALCTVAYARGDHLHGPAFGFLFAGVTLGLLWLLRTARMPPGKRIDRTDRAHFGERP